MSIFDLFKSKSSKRSSGTHTLVLIDGDSLRSQPELSFLRKAENPIVWIFTRHTDIRNWSEAKSRFDLIRQTLPVYETNLSLFLTYAALHELLTNPRYRHVILIAGNQQYAGLIEFLKEKGISAEFRNGDQPERREKMERRDRNERRERPERPPRNAPQLTERSERLQRNDREPRPELARLDSPRQERSKPAERPAEPAPKAPKTQPEVRERTPELLNNPELLNKVAVYFNEHYLPGKTYQKSFLGMLVNQATGKTTAEVLGTKSAKPLIKALLLAECIESIDEQSFQVLKPVQAHELKIPPLENAAKQSAKPPRKSNFPSHEASDNILEAAS